MANVELTVKITEVHDEATAEDTAQLLMQLARHILAGEHLSVWYENSRGGEVMARLDILSLTTGGVEAPVVDTSKVTLLPRTGGTGIKGGH